VQKKKRKESATGRRESANNKYRIATSGRENPTMDKRGREDI